jgi:multidrug transporter EmrE-like cation transporter
MVWVRKEANKKVNLKIVLLFAGNVMFNAVGNIMMKRGMNAVKDTPLNTFRAIVSNLALNPLLIIGAFSYVLSLVFYIFVLQKVSLNIAYPIVVACTAILVNIAAQFMLHESITWSQITGCGVIIGGIYLIVR